MQAQPDPPGARRAAPLPALLRTSRESAGLTRAQLAEKAGTSLAVIRDLEQGVTIRPRPGTLRLLGAALGVDLVGAAAGSPRPAGRPPAGQALAGLMGNRLAVQVLGPLCAWLDYLPMPVGTGRRQVLFGLLALYAGAVVSRDAISDILWGDDPPRSATVMIQSIVSGLRRILDAGLAASGGRLIVTVGTGYRLLVGGDGISLDLAAFRSLAERGRAALRAGRTAESCRLFDEAIRLWRGDPVEDVDALRAHPAVAALAGQRAALVIDYAEVASAHGWHDLILPHLHALADREPLNEDAHAALMIALAGTGQQAAALSVYEHLARRLDEQLGLRPSGRLAAAHTRVLRQDLVMAVRPPLAGSDAAYQLADGWPGASRPDVLRSIPHAQVVPGQLPAAVPHFTGRAAQLRRLTALLRGLDARPVRAGARSPIAVPVAVVSGPPGAGKTALAVHAAHRFRAEFPDGQLWAALGGTTTSPSDPGTVLGEFLRALGVPESGLPGTTTERATLYRSMLAGRRILVLADDAGSVAQVRPLLPGTGSSAMLITSRTPLVAPPGAGLVTVGPMSPPEAIEMLGHLAGAGRVAGEPAAARDLASACGYLPLALQIAGGKLAARPAWSIAMLAARADDDTGWLRELQAADLSVRAALADSYRLLSPGGRRTLRLLAVAQAAVTRDADLPEWAVIALLGRPEAVAYAAELVDGSLLSESHAGPGEHLRYRLPPLFWGFAAEMLLRDETAEEREDALGRLLAGWAQLAALAAARLGVPEPPEPGDGPVPSALALRLTADPAAWFDAERSCLLAAVRRAAVSGRHRIADRIAACLATYTALGERAAAAGIQ